MNGLQGKAAAIAKLFSRSAELIEFNALDEMTSSSIRLYFFILNGRTHKPPRQTESKTGAAGKSFELISDAELNFSFRGGEILPELFERFRFEYKCIYNKWFFNILNYLLTFLKNITLFFF